MDENEQEEAKVGFSEETNKTDTREKTEAEKSKPPKEELPIPATQKLPKQAEEKKPPAEARRGEKCVTDETCGGETPKERPTTAETPNKEKSGTMHYVLILTVLLLMASALCFGAIFLGTRVANGGSTPSDATAPEDETEAKEKIVFVRQYDDASGLLSLPELYATYADTVVSIQARGKNVSGVGSGFFIRDDGYIATVAHVVDGMEKITVITKAGERYEATVVASNAMTDLALLKIDGDGFPTATFGASDELLTGERVIAIGTPASLEYAGSLCTGEVSFALRSVKVYDESGRVLQKKMKLIQTNAAVNPGNSGCPLFDEYGRVIGIVTMKLGNEYVGLSFAIPSDGASAILGAMMRGESPTDEMLSLVSTGAPKLGVVGSKSESMGIAGVRIVGFSSSRCDAAIKLREGDLIIGIGGQPIASVEELEALVQERAPGESILVTVLRSEQRLTFEVILEKS